MKAERLLELYDRISEAPDAISRLRRFVLDLAVRGKLVEQDPEDEPAATLLQRVAKEKTRLSKTAASRKRTALPEAPIGQASFDIPETWEWVPATYPVHAISDSGRKVKTKDVLETGSFPVVDQGKQLVRGFCNDDSKVISVDQPLIVFGDHTRETKLIDFDFVVGADGVKLLQPVGIDPKYYFLVLQWLPLENRGYGRHFKLLKASYVPIPPLAEQHRIVAKVDELMALCDRLEEQHGTREATRDRLTTATLSRLTAPDTDEQSFRDHARFALDNLPGLTARNDQIKALRQAILDLAVWGKVVEQDPEDEPASELYERITAERAQLLQAKEISNWRKTQPVAQSDLTFSIPEGWVPVRLQNVLNELQTGPFGSSLHQSDYQTGGTPVINPASIQNERIVPVDKMAVGQNTLNRLESFKLRTGDIVMARRGEMGRCAIVSEHEEGWLCGTGSLILRPSTCLYARFLVLLISSPFGRGYLGGSAVGSTMQNLNQSILLNLPFGLPPVAEQRHIVAKVDELLALCDRLEASLQQADDKRARLLESLLAEALEPAEEALEVA